MIEPHLKRVDTVHYTSLWN